MTLAKQKFLSFLVVFTFIFSMIIGSSALAITNLDKQEGFGGGGSDTVAKVFSGSTAPNDIRVTVASLIRSFLGFVGIIFVVLIVYAGFLWMTAGGNESKIEESKKYLSRSLIGLIIILSAYSITGLILCRITDAAGGSVFSCMF